MSEFDVIVVGGGNAALCAALSANEEGAKVLVLEKAPKILRGGDSRLTGGGFRFAHRGRDEILEFLPDLFEREKEALVIPPYSKDDFYNDLMRVTQGMADPELAEVLVSESNPVIRWMTRLGIKWELATESMVRIGDKMYFRPGQSIRAKGGGQGLIDMEYDMAESRGINILYEAKAVKLLLNNKGEVIGVRYKSREGFKEAYSSAVILAAGGFQANPELRVRYLGPGWDSVKVRGSRFNTGEVLLMALEIGAQPAGQWSGCHCSVVDANGPPYEGGEAISRYSYPYGIMVNVQGKRYADEGEDYLPFTYAKFGRIILSQPHGIAYQIFDQKTIHLLTSAYQNVRPIKADTLEELAELLGIPPCEFVNQIKEFNNSVREDIPFNPAKRDGKHTIGIIPPKSNWAMRIDTPPFYAYPVTGGITFTFGGLKINKNAQVLDTEGNIIPGLYAAGEIVGGLFYYNYPSFSGLMSGSVFGRIAGKHAVLSR